MIKEKENLMKKIDALYSQYPRYSKEEELISTVGCWIHRASNSLIPNSSLMLAQDQVEIYQGSEDANKFLVEELWKVVNNAWDLYGEVEVAK